MSRITGTIVVGSTLSPTDTLDTYPVTDPIYGVDGLRSVASIVERDAISTQRRRVGMLVYTRSEGLYWKLVAVNTPQQPGDWEELKFYSDSAQPPVDSKVSDLNSPGEFIDQKLYIKDVDVDYFSGFFVPNFPDEITGANATWVDAPKYSIIKAIIPGLIINPNDVQFETIVNANDFELGTIIFDNNTNELLYWDGTEWVSLIQNQEKLRFTQISADTGSTLTAATESELIKFEGAGSVTTQTVIDGGVKKVIITGESSQGTSTTSPITPDGTTVIDFSQVSIIRLTLTVNQTLSFTNPVLDKQILIDVNASNDVILTLPATFKILSGEFVPNVKNAIYVHCIDITTPVYLVTISQYV